MRWLVVLVAVVGAGCSASPRDEFDKLVERKAKALEGLSKDGWSLTNIRGDIHKLGSDSTPYDGIIAFDSVVAGRRDGANGSKSLYKAIYEYQGGRWVFRWVGTEKDGPEGIHSNWDVLRRGEGYPEFRDLYRVMADD